MKKYFWMLGMLMTFSAFWSCIDDDSDYTNFRYVVRGIDSIAMPNTGTLGHPVDIVTYTTALENCQHFNSYGYDRIGNERTVVTWFVEYDVECGESSVVSPSLKFTPEEAGTYHFRFWMGQDEETQEDIFVTRDIVIE